MSLRDCVSPGGQPEVFPGKSLKVFPKKESNEGILTLTGLEDKMDKRYLYAGIFACCAVIVIVCASCGGRRQAPDPDLRAGSPIPADALPALPQSRGALAIVDDVRIGRQTFSRGGNASDNGTALELASTPDNLAWGIWAFDGTARDLTSLSYDFTMEAGQEVWIAIADYSLGRWEIHGPLTDDAQYPLDDAKHKSPDESVFCAATSGGSSATCVTITLTADTGDNLPPIADLIADPLSGGAPLVVAFDASNSYDSDGSIMQFEWDFDDNGVYSEPGIEQDNQDIPFVDNLYDAEGVYVVSIRVTDDGGLTANAQVTITVTPPNQPPTADLQANPTSGATPLLVDFDASLSSDLDDGIADYEWDFDGDGNYNETGLEFDARGLDLASYTYYAAGIYNPALRVTDGAGASDMASVEITVTGNLPPVADIQATPSEGAPPLMCSFDASASSDPDGTIANYEWDLDGDGAFGEAGAEADAAGNPAALYSYDAAGMYNATVRVTDDLGGTDEATVPIKAYGWVLVTLAVGDYYVGTSLAIVDGRPAIAFGSNAAGSVIYAHSSTPYGANPADWQLINVDGTTTSWENTLCIVEGKPAIGYQNYSTDEIRFAFSSTPDGDSAADWTSIAVDSGKDWASGPSLAVVSGNPAMAYFDNGSSPGAGDGNLWFARSTTVNGTSPGDWSAIAIAPAIGLDDYCSLAEVNGKPGLSYFTDVDGGLHFAFSSSAEGMAPGEWSSVLLAPDVGYLNRLAVIDGKPGVAYEIYDFMSGSKMLGFARSSSTGGTLEGDWSTVLVDGSHETFWGLSLNAVSGRPAIAYCDMTNWNLRFAESSTADGDTAEEWTNQLADGGEGAGEECSISEAQGCSAISYFFDGIEQSELRYAIRLQ
jgi:PKD repeat protein